MSVTIAANAQTIDHKGSGGYETNSTPDVCKTPDKAIPIPYSIMSKSSDLVRGSTTVFADGGNSVAIKGCAHSKCTGDEGGSMKGVVSGTNLHESTYITYSPNVYVEKKNICRLGDKMYMNNKNCISGFGGHTTIDLGGTDQVLVALCEIFCEAREEWLDCKHGPPPRSNCRRPSLGARDRVNTRLANGNSRLGRAVAQRVPGGFAAAERTLYTLGDQALDGARKFYNRTGLQNAIERGVRRAAASAGGAAAVRMTRRMWMKAVPGLNLLGLALDGYEIVTTGADIIQMIRESDSLMDDAIRVQPDFSTHNADGSVQDVYDFKFDDPVDGYQDDWNMDRNQKGIYDRSSTNGNAKPVNNDTCGCTTKHGPPSAGLS